MTDLSQIAECEWNEAYRRAVVLRPLFEIQYCSREKAHEAAVELGLSERQVYRLIQRLRESGGELTALLPGGSNGGRGKQRLAAPREPGSAHCRWSVHRRSRATGALPDSGWCTCG